VFTIKSNAILRWRSIYFSMETGQIYSVSHDCGSVPIDSVLKEVDTAIISMFTIFSEKLLMPSTFYKCDIYICKVWIYKSTRWQRTAVNFILHSGMFYTDEPG
jgi:hypothetical protein